MAVIVKEPMRAADVRNKDLEGNWKYVGPTTVSDGRRTVYLTSGVKPDDAMRHIKGVLAQKHKQSID